jgi:hypothetical protein
MRPPHHASGTAERMPTRRNTFRLSLQYLSVSQALWSALTVFTSFAWGAWVFREPIAHPIWAAVGLTIMAASVVGIGFAMLRTGPPAGFQALDARSSSSKASTTRDPAAHALEDSPSWQEQIGSIRCL